MIQSHFQRSHIQRSLFRKGYLWIKVKKRINFDGVLKYGTLNKIIKICFVVDVKKCKRKGVQHYEHFNLTISFSIKHNSTDQNES